MISRFCVQCCVCGSKIITRTAIIDIPYQEFAFPCPGCSIEIRFGITTNAPNWKYTKLINAIPLLSDEGITNIRVFDANHLIPLDNSKSFSPFMTMAEVLDGSAFLRYQLCQGIHHKAVDEFWPQLEKLLIHFKNKQWDLFDEQLIELYRDSENYDPSTDKKKDLYHALERYSTFFRKENGMPEFIKERIKLAENSSDSAVKDLLEYFFNKNKHTEIDEEIQIIRKRWTNIYNIVAPIFITQYWDKTKYSLSNFTLAQKRFDDLKTFYIDCFETFCRISVIAAGIEGIIATQTACVLKARGNMTIEQFDVLANGSKSDILGKMVIVDLFVPFIDHRLRNGIGHNAARYDVVDDKIDYQIENRGRIQRFSISYVNFCEKVVSMYEQFECVTFYSNWIQLK